MKLSAYIITVDTGFSPNPFGHHCTLACCKPTIRRKAKKNDIIIATASARMPKPGHLIYAMRVKEVICYQKYWRDSRFQQRKPTQDTAISRRGDNIWHRDTKGKWVKPVPGAFHDNSRRDRDTRGENVVISTKFFYFGKDAIPVPARFKSLLATTQGHRNTHDCDIIERFWAWVCGKASKPGRVADPSEFTDDGCRAQCDALDAEDFEEV
jgi:hypothetical protein